MKTVTELLLFYTTLVCNYPEKRNRKKKAREEVTLRTKSKDKKKGTSKSVTNDKSKTK
jgi:hypothetical protein